LIETYERTSNHQSYPAACSYRFISELVDIFLMAGVHQQPDQSNYLAEG